MTKSELIAKVAKQTGISASNTENVLNAFVENIIDSLKTGESVTIAGFGRFEMRQRKTKAYTNPKTKTKSQLQPTSIPGFKASGQMKQRISSK